MKKKIVSKSSFLLIVILMMGLQGCIYTMPSEDDFSEVPHTNNPAVTEEQPNRLLLPKG